MLPERERLVMLDRAPLASILCVPAPAPVLIPVVPFNVVPVMVVPPLIAPDKLKLVMLERAPEVSNLVVPPV